MKNKKITSLILCITILFCTLLSPQKLNVTSAVTNNEIENVSVIPQTYKGVILSSEKINLSNIEVKIFSKELVYEENGMQFLGGTYEYSVFTDSSGNFSFQKPSEYCSYTIVLSTLPAEYGLNDYSVDINPTEYTGNLSLEKISSVETYIEDFNVKANFYDKNGFELFVDYTAIADSTQKNVLFNSESSNNIAEKYTSIKNLNIVNFNGTIVTNGASYKYNEQYDATELTPLKKIDLLYSLGMVDEDAKYNLYSAYLKEDAIDQNDCIGLLTCKTANNYLNSESSNDYTFTNRPSYIYTEEREIRENYTINIHYSNDFVNMLDGLPINCDEITINDLSINDIINQIESSINSLLSKFSYLRFPTTQISTTNDYIYHIYFTLNDETNHILGESIPEKDLENNGTGNSYMIIYYNFIYDLVTSHLQNTYSPPHYIAKKFIDRCTTHEFSHSILFKHGMIGNLWAHEGFSSAIEFIQSEYTDNNTKTIANSYINNPHLSLTSSASENSSSIYRAMLFFFCLYKNFGNWNALDSYINNLYLINNVISNDTNPVTDPIFKALTVTFNGVTYDYIDVFSKMACYNYDYEKLYDWNWIQEPVAGTVSPAWDKATPYIVNIGQTITNFTLSPLAYNYFKYVNNTSDSYNVKCKIEVTDRVDKFTFAMLREDQAGNLFIGNKIIRNYDNLTILVESLGENDYKSLIMIPINVHTSGNPINYWVRSSTY